MTLITPSTFLFSSTLLLSTIMAISTPNTLFMWMMLELNLLSFIPIMTSSMMKKETESAIKYFLAQALGSGLFLISTITSISTIDMILSPLPMTLLFFIGLMTKLGAAPFHLWFPQVMSDSPWINCMILSTWQKIIPLSIMMFTSNPPFTLIFIISSISALVGGLGGLMQTQLTSLLAYSSINHLSWMFATMIISPFSTMVYFIIYILSTLPVMFLFMISNLYSFKQMLNTNMSNSMKMSMVLLLLSLGGFPPLLGFIPKLLVLNNLMQNSYILLTMFLIFGAMMSLSYYINIVLLLTSLPTPFTLKLPSTNSFMLLMIPMSTLTSLSAPLLILYAVTLLHKS